MEWLHSIDPIGVGDIAGLLWFVLGRLSMSRPGAISGGFGSAAAQLRRLVFPARLSGSHNAGGWPACQVPTIEQHAGIVAGSARQPAERTESQEDSMTAPTHTRAAQNRAEAAAIVTMVAEREAAIAARAAAAPVAYWPAEIDGTDYDAGWHRAAAARRAQRHRATRRAAAAAKAAR